MERGEYRQTGEIKPTDAGVSSRHNITLRTWTVSSKIMPAQHKVSSKLVISEQCSCRASKRLSWNSN